MQFTTLETDRLILRAINPDVYQHVFGLPRNEAKIFFGYDTDVQLNNERKRFEKGLQTYNKTFLYFQLIDKKSNLVMGWSGFHTWYRDHDRAELGYVLNEDAFKRKGFMSEAIPPILAYGFDEMNLHRIEAFASSKNIPSIKLLKSNGFEKEGLLKEHYLHKGVYEDSEIYGLIRSN